MSGRGGRGGRGGGRGGSRGKPAPPGMPGGDDPSLIVNDQPQETYPKSFQPPVAPPLTPVEERAVAYFIKFRQTYHNTPLYTHRHVNAEFQSAGAPVLARYGQTQINARYSVKNRAAVDPFLSVPTYSERFVDDTRTLPKLRGTRSWVKDLFPEELWGTLEGKDTNGPKGGFQTKENLNRPAKRRALDEDDDDVLGDGDDDDEMFVSARSTRRRENETEEERKARIEGAGKDVDNEDGDAGEADDDDEEEMEVEDDDYDSAEDDEGGDYNAEAYFDNGDDDDFGDDDGVGESAMDF